MSNFDKEAFERIERQFTSTNSNPVDRASIRAQDWEAAKQHMQSVNEQGAEPVAHPCWSCGESVSFTERTNNDGDCPHCGVELHADDWPVRAQDVPEADGWIKCSERLPPASEWISGQTDTGRVIPAKLIDNGDSTYFRVANDELSEGAIVGWQPLPGAIKRPQPPQQGG